MDLQALSQSLPDLLNAYAKVVEQVDSGPLTRLHRRPSAAARSPNLGLLDRFTDFGLAPLRWLGDWWWGFSLRPMVRLFVETHVSARASEMGRFLRPKRLMMAEGSEEETRRLDEHLRSVGYAEGMVAGGSRSLGPIRYIPPVVFALSWILIALNSRFRELQTELILLALTAFPFLVLIVYAVVVKFGFRWKRALFMAWKSGAALGVDRTSPQESNDPPSIYQLETRVHADMGLRKRPEFPIDVVLHPAPYWLLTMLADLGILLRRGDLTVSGLFAVALLLLLCLVSTVGVIRRYRERRRAELV